MNRYYKEETAEKLVKIGFYETVQYFKVINRVKDEIYHPKLPDPNEDRDYCYLWHQSLVGRVLRYR